MTENLSMMINGLLFFLVLVSFLAQWIPGKKIARFAFKCAVGTFALFTILLLTTGISQGKPLLASVHDGVFWLTWAILLASIIIGRRLASSRVVFYASITAFVIFSLGQIASVDVQPVMSAMESQWLQSARIVITKILFKA